MVINFFSLANKVAFLKIPPEAWDAIIPHSYKASQYMVEYMAASVVRDIAKLIEEEEIQVRLLDVGKEMATMASQNLVQGWEEGDDICPPWWIFPKPPVPWPWGVPQPDQGPRPDPWKVKTIGQLVLAELLTNIAEVTTNVEISSQLQNTALTLATSYSGQLIRDFEQVGIVPRNKCST